MTELQKALNTIQKEINFICENMDSFIDRFCHPNTFDVYGISFDGINIIWVTVEDSGAHLKHERTIAQYLRWRDSF